MPKYQKADKMVNAALTKNALPREIKGLAKRPDLDAAVMLDP